MENKKYKESLCDKVVRLTNQLIFSGMVVGVGSGGTYKLWQGISQYREQISDVIYFGGYCCIQVGIAALELGATGVGVYIVAKGVGKVIYELNEDHFNNKSKH